MNVTLEQAKQLELQNNKDRNKNKLKKKGENALYAELKRHFPNGLAYGAMKIKDYVELLKKELQIEKYK